MEFVDFVGSGEPIADIYSKLLKLGLILILAGIISAVDYVKDLKRDLSNAKKELRRIQVQDAAHLDLEGRVIPTVGLEDPPNIHGNAEDDEIEESYLQWFLRLGWKYSTLHYEALGFFEE